MRKYMRVMGVMGLILLSTSSFANEHQLMDKKQCTEMKEGIGYFLGVADYLFKEIKKLEGMSGSEKEKQGTEKELWEGALAMSQLSANYSTVYEVLCTSDD